MATWNEQFQKSLLQWYDAGKRVLPWRESRDPYAIWVSEIMLQQTRVEAVIPYFERFMTAFPTVEVLAKARQEEVLKLWEGLGYYSRARNLHAAAQRVVEELGGKIPSQYAEIRRLPGVGDYTAGAILSIAFNQPFPAVDGNVKRVFSRMFAIADDVKRTDVKRRIERLAEDLIAPGRASDFNQALMELGALICIPKAPRCSACPVQALCAAYAEGEPMRYPVKSTPREPVPVVRLVAIVRQVVEGCERFLLVQNPPEGLLAGLWGFPGLDLAPTEWSASGLGHKAHSERVGQPISLLEIQEESDPDSDVVLQEKICARLKEYLRVEHGLEVKIGDVIDETRYTFTHRSWTMPLFSCECVDVLGDGKGFAKMWVLPNEFDQYAIPTVYQKVIQTLWGAGIRRV